MKRAFFIALTALTIIATAQAETTEATVAFQLKLQTTPEPTVLGKNVVIKTNTVTYKTSDVIAQIVEAESLEFTKKARLIYQYTYSASSETKRYIIREKGLKDYIVKSSVFHFNFGPHINTDVAPYTRQGKRTTEAPYVGTETFRGYGTFIWRPNNEDKVLELHGPFSDVYRHIASKQSSGEIYTPNTVSMSGIGSFYLNLSGNSSTSGVVDGTVKYSAPKLLKTE